MTRLQKCQILKEKGYTYSPSTGKIYGVFGKEITSKHRDGYIHIICSTHFKGGLFGHHFAWFMTYNNVDFNELDHINRVPDDNRIHNLRIISHQENCFNTSGKGFYWNKQANKWQSKITLNGKSIHLGLFNTEDEARECYLKAKEKLHIISN